MPMPSSISNILRFLPHPRIVAIDNDPEQLQSIAEGLNSIGLPCITMLYSQEEGLRTPTHWESAFVRIVFLDLNLGDFELSTESSSLMPCISDVLKKLSPTGPFLIVFWTKHKQKVAEVMEQLAAREKGRVPFPADFVTIDKTPFIKVNGTHDENALRCEIYQALAQPKLLLALHAWESESEKAAGLTLDAIHNLILSPQSDGKAQNIVDLEDLLKSLGKAAWGKINAKENPSGAISSGLAPIFLDQLDKCTNEVEYRNVWKETIKNGWNRDLPALVSRPKLNAHCLVDKNCTSHTRGCWLEFTKGAFRRKNQWLNYYGCDTKQLQMEFINPKKENASDLILGSVHLGLLECTAACDYINNKAPLLRYILGARIPVDKLEHVEWKDPIRDKKHDAIYKIEIVFCNDGEYALFLDFKYVIHLPKGHNFVQVANAAPLFRIRKQLLADIAARYAAYTTRPGVYSFASLPLPKLAAKDINK
jgi:hypothetical protein